MSREQRIAIWVVTLIGMLVAWKLFGQGFGGFRSDQPFLARNYTASSEPWPESALLLTYFDTRSATNVITNNVGQVTNWVNISTATDPATNEVGGPYWVSSGGLSNYGFVRFYGTNVIQFCPTNNGAITNLPITVAMIHSHSAPAGNEGVWSVNTIDGGGVQPTAGMLIESTYGNPGLDIINSTRGSACTIETRRDPTADEWIRTVATYDSAAGIMLFTNGVYVGAIASSCGATKAGPIRIGKWNDMSILLNGRVHRFMLWRGNLSSNDCISVDSLLKTQFGL